jgi:hypothetical protein
MLNKIDKLLHTTKLLTNFDVIPDSTGDSEVLPTPHPPYFPYETADFSSILDNISTLIYFSFIYEIRQKLTHVICNLKAGRKLLLDKYDTKIVCGVFGSIWDTIQ